MLSKRMQTSFVVVLMFCAVGESVASGWQGGVAKTNITPPQWMPMAGYASRKANHATAKLTNLWAKAVVIEDASGHQAVLVTLDLIGIDRPLSQKICQRIAEKHSLARSQISLATSHTHTGPVVASNLRPMHYLLFDELNQKLVDDYALFLADSVVKVVDEAFSDLSEAKFSWGSGKETFAVNRRNNPEKDVPQLRESGQLKGPSDHDVPVLVMRKNDEVDAIVFGYACHSTTISTFDWSGDYGGFAQLNLEKKYPGAIALFWAGCGGDQNPLPRRTVELVKEYGQRLADAVSRVVDGSLTNIEGSLETAYQEIDLALAELPTMEQLEEQSKSSNVYISSRAKFHLERAENGIEMSKTYPYPVQVWKLGTDIEWVFLGGEVVIDFAIRIKETHGAEEFNNQNVWVAGYSNDVMAYIPSRRVLLEGGYEGGGAMIYYGLPTVWAQQVEETIVNAVKELSE